MMTQYNGQGYIGWRVSKSMPNSLKWYSYHVSSQIDAEDGDGAKRQRYGATHEEEEGRDLRNVRGKSVGDRFLEVVEDESTFLDTSDNRGEVVIQENHVSGLLRYIGAGNTHGDTWQHHQL